MIHKTIKNIKKILYKVLERIFTAKLSKKKKKKKYQKHKKKKKKKKTLQGFGENTYSKNSKYKKNFFCLSYI